MNNSKTTAIVTCITRSSLLAVQLSPACCTDTPDTFQKSRRSASEGAFLAKGGPLAAVEGGWVDMVLVWDTTVHRLTGHLLVPLPICASHGDAGLHLEVDTRLQPPQPAKERSKLL